MLPGFSQELMPKGREKESQAKIKRYMTMMDSMTNEGEFVECSKLNNNMGKLQRLLLGSYLQKKEKKKNCYVLKLLIPL